GAPLSFFPFLMATYRKVEVNAAIAWLSRPSCQFPPTWSKSRIRRARRYVRRDVEVLRGGHRVCRHNQNLIAPTGDGLPETEQALRLYAPVHGRDSLYVQDGGRA